ncbi:MAG: GNAT family N-acetyltransferase [Cellulosilyticum sp.]|nr:GNAT family N-acetyltransferase [Cellulosilyticum sp.]
MNTPILQTERLLLRPFYKEDARAVFETWESDSEVAQYMFWKSHKDIHKTEAWIAKEIEKVEEEDWYRWAITLKETEVLIGTGLIYVEDEYGEYEIAYNLGKKFWGQGYTTEAMAGIIQFAKETLGVKKIMGRHAKENISSGRVMEKLGFSYVQDIPYECNEGVKVYEGKEYILEL